MKWNDVRNIYPNQFVLLTSLQEHIENNKKYIDDVAIVKPLKDEETGDILKNFVCVTD